MDYTFTPRYSRMSHIVGRCAYSGRKRPAFRREKGQHSDSIAATIPTKKASIQ